MDEEQLKKDWEDANLSRQEKQQLIIEQYNKIYPDGYLLRSRKKSMLDLIDKGFSYEITLYLSVTAKNDFLIREAADLFEKTQSIEKLKLLMESDIVKSFGGFYEDSQRMISVIKKIIEMGIVKEDHEIDGVDYIYSTEMGRNILEDIYLKRESINLEKIRDQIETIKENSKNFLYETYLFSLFLITNTSMDGINVMIEKIKNDEGYRKYLEKKIEMIKEDN
jgi:hypothetical protein